jgi:holliday junction DNA helicase RuvA
MYAYFEGKLTLLNPTMAVVDCQGVGYEMQISLYTYSQVRGREQCRLFTHLAVREDAHVLYGFADEEERRIFRHLISVSGVGANTARMILSSMSPQEVFNAIVRGDSTRLQAVKGIGAKSAQRIVVDLNDKIKKEEFVTGNFPVADNSTREESLSALSMLGFNKAAAAKVVDAILRSEGENMKVEELIKKALQRL